VLISAVLNSVSFALLLLFGPLRRREKRSQGIDIAA